MHWEPNKNKIVILEKSRSQFSGDYFLKTMQLLIARKRQLLMDKKADSTYNADYVAAVADDR